MAAQDLLRNKVDETPTIYAYTLPDVPKYEDADNVRELEAREIYDEGLMPLRTGAYLYLSGTPFRAMVYAVCGSM